MGYINFDIFTFKVGGCIDIVKRSLLHSRDSVTKIDILNYLFGFDEINRKREINCNHFFNVRIILVEAKGDEISYRPLELTLCIMELNRFSQKLHVSNPKLFRIKISFKIHCVLSKSSFFVTANTCKQLISEDIDLGNRIKRRKQSRHNSIYIYG